MDRDNLAVRSHVGDQEVSEHRQTYLGTAPALACGLLGGLVLGVAARAWMRLISEKHEFTWSERRPLSHCTN